MISPRPFQIHQAGILVDQFPPPTFPFLCLAGSVRAFKILIITRAAKQRYVPILFSLVDLGWAITKALDWLRNL